MTNPKTVAAPLIVLPVLVVLYTFLGPELRNTFLLAGKTACGTNLKSLHNLMSIYASEHNQLYPTPSKWCDLLMKKSEVTPKYFCCKVAPEKGRCHYAMNSSVEKLGTNTPPDLVLLFETAPGWNQNGGPELISALNHKNEGCNMLFTDGHVEFIDANDFPKLKWKPEQP